MLKKNDTRGVMASMLKVFCFLLYFGQRVLMVKMQEMDLEHVVDRNIDVLSGGELQRFSIAATAVTKVGWVFFVNFFDSCHMVANMSLRFLKNYFRVTCTCLTSRLRI